MNPYTAPEAPFSADADPAEPRWAWELRARHAVAERSVRQLRRINLLIALPFGLMAAMGLGILIGGPLDMGNGPIDRREAILLFVIGIGVSGLNVGTARGLERLIPWARWSEIVLSVVALINALRFLPEGLENGGPTGFWLFWVAIPVILSGVVLSTLLSPSARILFREDYQRALVATGRQPLRWDEDSPE